MTDTTFDYDLFVIGGGSGGVRAARISAQYGARVGVAEEHRYGGTCVIRGCVPKKLMVYASSYAEHFEDALGFGWSVGETSFDWAKLIAAKDAEITRLEGIYRRNLNGTNVELHDTRAVIEGPHEVRLVNEDRVVSAKHILIAVGGAPFVPDIPGKELAITSNEIFDLKEQPKRAIVAGGGYIACEFAGILNGLGTQTTQVQRSARILKEFDEEVSDAVREEMEAKGVRIRLNETIASIEKTATGLLVSFASGESQEVDQVLYATGRAPATSGLGLEKADVELGRRGEIPVNEYSQTTTPSVYAVGDVTNRVNLTPVAIREGHAFADTIFGGTPKTVDHTLIPTAVFTQPEIGVVGLTEAQARAQEEVEIYRSRFRPMLNTISGRAEKMLMKIVVSKTTRKVLGVHIVGHGAGEMIQCLGVAIVMGATKEDFDRTMAVHPTAAEELMTMRTPVES